VHGNVVVYIEEDNAYVLPVGNAEPDLEANQELVDTLNIVKLGITPDVAREIEKTVKEAYAKKEAGAWEIKSGDERKKRMTKFTVVIHFGKKSIENREDFEGHTLTREFASQAELDAYMTGCYDSNGWMDYVVHEGYVVSANEEFLSDSHVQCSPDDCDVCAEWEERS
jgi:hypothetical protein